MKVLAINSTYRKKGTTTRLTEQALEGAASRGAETEMVLLMEQDIRLCRNCLQCYKDVESTPIGPCPVEDDVTAIAQKIHEADGVIFSSPIHNGFLTGLMVLLIERLTFRMCVPGGEIAGFKGCPRPRSTDKVRAVGSIVSAGGMPGKFRKMCDGTPWLRENMPAFLHAHWVGDIYADARLTKLPETDEDWQRIFLLRKLTKTQLREAYDLGVEIAAAAAREDLRPTPPVGGFTSAVLKAYLKVSRTYKLVGDDGACPPGVRRDENA